MLLTVSVVEHAGACAAPCDFPSLNIQLPRCRSIPNEPLILVRFSHEQVVFFCVCLTRLRARSGGCVLPLWVFGARGPGSCVRFGRRARVLLAVRDLGQYR